jgi:general secretion pathway protein F
MPVYEYSAIDEKGKTKTGIIDAESALAARQKIRGLGSFPVSIKEIYDSGSKKQTPRQFSISRFFTRIKAGDTAMMTRQLSTLLSAGLPLVTAMDTLIPQTKSHAFKAMLAQIKDTIVEGNSFANALGMYPNVFSTLYTNMVRAGESSGTLEIVLERLADVTENQQALKQRIQSAMAYPILMSLIGISVLFFLLTNVVPQITTIFEDLGQTLPTPTIILIHISSFMESWWWMFLIAAGVMAFSIQQIKRTVKGKYYWDRTRLRLPVFGNLMRKLAISRFSRTLGSLLENGVSMLSALDIVKNISDNSLIIQAVENASEYVSKGQSLAVSLAESDIFPSLPIQMIRVGEQSGELEPMLGKVADIFEREVESSILSLTALMEPIMILLMAVIVGFIVLSICLPIFEMSQLVA